MSDSYLVTLSRVLLAFGLLVAAVCAIPAMFADPLGAWAAGGVAGVIVGGLMVAMAWLVRWMAHYLGDDEGI